MPSSRCEAVLPRQREKHNMHKIQAVSLARVPILETRVVGIKVMVMPTMAIQSRKAIPERMVRLAAVEKDCQLERKRVPDRGKAKGLIKVKEPGKDKQVVRVRGTAGKAAPELELVPPITVQARVAAVLLAIKMEVAKWEMKMLRQYMNRSIHRSVWEMGEK